jgi:CRP/FNR family transcriptional regulator, cyclic AMP receptor protein
MEATRYLTDEERVRLLTRAESRSYTPNEVMLAEGDYNEDIYILVGGSARVEKQVGDEHRIVGRIRPGEAFGEMSLLDASPTYLSVVADEPAEAFVLPLASVADLLEEDPALASHLYHSLAVMLARRLRERTSEIVTSRR